jgi:hypothetical protein
VSEEDEAGALWGTEVAREWFAELKDQSQDIHTLEHGQPVTGRPEFRETHLKVVSVLRLHKLATIHCPSLVRRPGKSILRNTRWLRQDLRALLL